MVPPNAAVRKMRAGQDVKDSSWKSPTATTVGSQNSARPISRGGLPGNPGAYVISTLAQTRTKGSRTAATSTLRALGLSCIRSNAQGKWRAARGEAPSRPSG
jgi:hypothetical protein